MRLPLRRRVDGRGPRTRGVHSTGGWPAGRRRRSDRTADRRPAASHQLELDIFARNRPSLRQLSLFVATKDFRFPTDCFLIYSTFIYSGHAATKDCLWVFEFFFRAYRLVWTRTTGTRLDGVLGTFCMCIRARFLDAH